MPHANVPMFGVKLFGDACSAVLHAFQGFVNQFCSVGWSSIPAEVIVDAGNVINSLGDEALEINHIFLKKMVSQKNFYL